MWKGRFRKETHELTRAFTESVSFDARLAPHDIAGSVAHVTMLAECGILAGGERDRIVRGLRAIARDIEAGRFIFDPALEDVHMNIERALTERIGAVGAKLHTARSRNDQVALDLRLYLRSEVRTLCTEIGGLQAAFVDQAEACGDVILPGYTHLQRAQPVLLAHHLLAYVEMLERDRDRLDDALSRVEVLPLGSAALAGTTLPIDPRITARLLGFKAIARNSMDAVSDRDFALEIAADLAILAVHLSRYAEEIVLWSTAEFGFVRVDEAFCTGSSLMPQKRNPDVAELVRGRAGRANGALVALLTVVKGLPLTYNRDLQEDKIPLFETVDNAHACLRILDPMTRSLAWDVGRMSAAAADPGLLATDLAEHLVGRGVPFRTAHEIVGRLVALAEDTGRPLDALTPEEMRSLSKAFDRDCRDLFNSARSVRKRATPGGTAPSSVTGRIRAWRRRLAKRSGHSRKDR